VIDSLNALDMEVHISYILTHFSKNVQHFPQITPDHAIVYRNNP